MPRHWNSANVVSACKAYTEATLNRLVGADQDFSAFSQEVTLRMVELSPAAVEEAMCHKHSLHIFPYLCNRFFPEFQKSNRALRHIYAYNPTGIAEQQKWNLAGAIFVGEMKKLEYAFKDFDAAKKCKFYSSS